MLWGEMLEVLRNKQHSCFTWLCLGNLGIPWQDFDLVCGWELLVEGKVSGKLEWWFRDQCNVDGTVWVVLCIL